MAKRGTENVRLQVRPTQGPEGTPVIGVIVSQAADIELPLDVEIDTGGVGGPSAGLAFALALMEELGRDVDRGHRIAVTGSLELDGTVGQIGGVKQKTVGVERADIDVFLVPGWGKRDRGPALRRWDQGHPCDALFNRRCARWQHCPRSRRISEFLPPSNAAETASFS